MDDLLGEAVQSLCESIRFDSSQRPPEAGMPFGRGAYDCLCHFLSLAERLGFETHNYDGYIGEAVFGEGEPFAILAHLDVVPAGGGWTKDPFGGVVQDGAVWGRGAVDDKGPAICCLYALKGLKDRGVRPKRQIRLIVGCNEENGWECIKHYEKVASLPESGFSPDADFPVIYAEKGIFQFSLAFRTEGDFSSLCGGERVNMVCDYCEAEAERNDERLAALGLSYENGKVVSRGKSAHGSTPDQGKNAIPPMLAYLGQEETLTRLSALKTELETLCDETGRLTFSPDTVRGEKGGIVLECDVRYPATFSEESVKEILTKSGIPYRVLHAQAPLYQKKDGALVSALLSVYEECTGRRAEPVAIGGGTYARALKCGAAFGPEMEGDAPVVHQADEFITVERLKLLLDIYGRAIERLTC